MRSILLPVLIQRRAARAAPAMTWVIACFIALGAMTAVSAQTPAKARVIASGYSFVVDIADTRASQARGLGGRRHLGAHEGMLFLYTDKSHHAFWMKDMVIPIDIIWLDNRRIVHIEHYVRPPAPNTPDHALRTYTPPQPANLVLEIAAGRARELKLKPGDLVGYDFSGR